MDEAGRCGRNRGYLVCLCDACEEDVDKAVTGMARWWGCSVRGVCVCGRARARAFVRAGAPARAPASSRARALRMRVGVRVRACVRARARVRVRACALFVCVRACVRMCVRACVRAWCVCAAGDGAAGWPALRSGVRRSGPPGTAGLGHAMGYPNIWRTLRPQNPCVQYSP